MTIATMRRQFERAKKKLHEDIPIAILDEALEMRLHLAILNPEDTGRSEASWNLNLDTPNLDRKPEDWNNPGPASEYAGEVDFDGWALGRSIHISNTQDYIRRLEAGWSLQAPQGFVGPTLLLYSVIFRERFARVAAA